MEQIKKKPLKLNVSFKKKEEDLYDYINSHRSPGNFIKDCVEFFRQYNGKSLQVEVKEEPVEEIENEIDESEVHDMLTF